MPKEGGKMEKIKNNIKIIIIILIIMILVPAVIIYENKNKTIENEPIEFNTSLEENPKTEEKKLKIDIKGEIKKPGVYELKENDRVSDAIKIAGGLTENADTTLINLSKTLKDEMVIIIYNKEDLEKLRQELKETKKIIEQIEKQCTCPDTVNEACIKEAPKQTQTKSETKELTKEDKISINTGTLEELLTLPGIGESKAQQIIKYREQNNGFKTIEEIKNISGIGESTFEKFKDYITL